MRRGSQPTVDIPSPEADALVERAIEGDVEAFAALFEATFPSVYRFLLGRCGDPALTEDLAQDAYLRAMRAIRTSFKGRSSDFLAWVLRIARNRFFDHLKSGKVKWEMVVDEMPPAIAPGDPEEEALAGVEGESLRQVLESLTEEQQEIVYMRFFHGLRISEVARITGRTQGAVKALQFRALRSLEKQILEERAKEV